jgi:hypothetical protein
MCKYPQPLKDLLINRVQDCGAPLYGDFNDIHPGEVEKLGIELQATGYELEVQDSHGVKHVPTDQGQVNGPKPVTPAPQRSNAAQSAPAPPTNPNVSDTLPRHLHSFSRPDRFTHFYFKTVLT